MTDPIYTVDKNVKKIMVTVGESTDSPYKCTTHKLDFACLGCVRAHIKKKEKLLEFVKSILEEFTDDFIFDKEEHLLWKDTEEPLFKSEFLCVYLKFKANNLLKEIGEIE